MIPKSLALASMAAFALGTAVALAFPAFAGTPAKSARIPQRPAADTAHGKVADAKTVHGKAQEAAVQKQTKPRKLAKQDQGKVASLKAREHRKTAELNRKQNAARRAKTTRTASKD